MTEPPGGSAHLDEVTALALLNYGHYTAMRVDERRVRGLSWHLDRLMRDCRRVFDAELDPDWVRHLIRRALTETPRSIVVRVSVFDPALELSHPGADARPQLLVTTRAAAPVPLPALRLQSSAYRRELPEVKHVGLFGSLHRRRIAQRNGFDDVVFTDADGTLSEAATSNIGFLDGDRIVWPQADCLAGVTMRLISESHGGQVSTAALTLSQVADMDAAFVTNAVVGIRSVSAIDGIQWPAGHPVLHTLRQQYATIPAEPL
ncbi:MAG: aminotransferase class IV family protein [Pseudonocardiales bacterium]|nr:aminotransferase class IV family protein [Pseudonocardiales bacterium]